MRFHHHAVLIAAAFLAGSSLQAQTVSTNEETAVRRVVATYLHGLQYNDVPSFRAAFWPETKLLWRKRDGTLGQLTQEDWYKNFTASAGKKEEGNLRIAALEITGDIAAVKVVEDYPGSRYTDYISLVKFDGGWKIVAKVYTSEKR